MARYLKPTYLTENIKITSAILALLGLFLLNACSPRAGMQPVISDREAVKFQTGKIQSQPTKIPQKHFPEEVVLDPTADQSEDTLEFDELNILTDFNSKKVKISTNVKVGEHSQLLNFDGDFDESGIAYATSKNKDNQDNALATVRCLDGCNVVLTEIAVKRINEQGEEVVEIQQFTQTKEQTIDQPQTPSAGEKQEDAESDLSMDAEFEKPEFEEFDEDPGVAAGYVSAFTNENLAALIPINSEKDTQPRTPPSKDDDSKNGTPKSNEVFDEKIFPKDLGDKYRGEAIGFYAACASKSIKKINCIEGKLVNGTDIVSIYKNVLKSIAGFMPVRYADGFHFGTGLTIKLIEEVGEDFKTKYPTDSFEVGDISKKFGGPSGHKSHRTGLDIDVPISRKGRTGHWDTAKDWELIKMFVSYKLIDRIFFSAEKIKSICEHIKKTGEKNFEEAFSKLYPEENHTKHFHVRVVCTKHNLSCQIADYDPRKTPKCQ